MVFPAKVVIECMEPFMGKAPGTVALRQVDGFEAKLVMCGRCMAATVSITAKTQGERTTKREGFRRQVERIGKV